METIGLSCPVTAVLLLDRPRLIAAAFGRRLRVWASDALPDFGAQGDRTSAHDVDVDGDDRAQKRARTIAQETEDGLTAGPSAAGEIVVFPGTSRIHGIRLLAPSGMEGEAGQSESGEIINPRMHAAAAACFLEQSIVH